MQQTLKNSDYDIRKLGTDLKKDESSQLADSSLISDNYRKDLTLTECFMCWPTNRY